MNSSFYDEEVFIHDAFENTPISTFFSTVSMNIESLLFTVQHSKQDINPVFSNVLNCCQFLQESMPLVIQQWPYCVYIGNSTNGE